MWLGEVHLFPAETCSPPSCFELFGFSDTEGMKYRYMHNNLIKGQ